MSFLGMLGSEINGLLFCFFHLGRTNPPQMRRRFYFVAFDPVIPWQVALQQSPPLFHWTRKLNPFTDWVKGRLQGRAWEHSTYDESQFYENLRKITAPS